ncbi:hypothetical protein FS749_014978 [Ceratobasidium sp. UAMH 11750]|nr:hypothetical protein FS749_014978 [Ceratobasidium sp. UAMH 11750]
MSTGSAFVLFQPAVQGFREVDRYNPHLPRLGQKHAGRASSSMQASIRPMSLFNLVLRPSPSPPCILAYATSNRTSLCNQRLYDSILSLLTLPLTSWRSCLTPQAAVQRPVIINATYVQGSSLALTPTLA